MSNRINRLVVAHTRGGGITQGVGLEDHDRSKVLTEGQVADRHLNHLIDTLAGVKHGTLNAYNLACRCPLCKAFMKGYRLERKAARAAKH
jgi:hypothetical protein